MPTSPACACAMRRDEGFTLLELLAVLALLALLALLAWPGPPRAGAGEGRDACVRLWQARDRALRTARVVEVRLPEGGAVRFLPDGTPAHGGPLPPSVDPVSGRVACP